MLVDTIISIDKAKNNFLSAIRRELLKKNIPLQAIQYLVLHKVYDKEVTIGFIKKSGIYIGTNSSYTIKKLISHNFVTVRPSNEDKRIILLQITPKAIELVDSINSFLNHRYGELQTAEDVIRALGCPL